MELEKGRTRKPSTINRELQILSRIFSLAIWYGVTDKNPCAEVSLLPENNKRVRYLFDDEEQRLLSVLTGPLVAASDRCDRHRDETRRSFQADVGEGRFPAWSDLRAEFKNRKRLLGANE